MLIVFVSGYVFISLRIGFKVDNLVRTCYDTHGKYSDSMIDTISEHNYDMLNYRDCGPEFNAEIIENNIRTFPIAIHTFNKAYAYYVFSYDSTIKKTGEGIAGCADIPVRITLEFKNWKWVVTDVFQRL